jgi:hypothetical protein
VRRQHVVDHQLLEAPVELLELDAEVDLERRQEVPANNMPCHAMHIRGSYLGRFQSP